jgi:hypothetical protein
MRCGFLSTVCYCTTQQNEGNAPKRQKAKNGAISEILFEESRVTLE